MVPSHPWLWPPLPLTFLSTCVMSSFSHAHISGAVFSLQAMNLTSLSSGWISAFVHRGNLPENPCAFLRAHTGPHASLTTGLWPQVCIFQRGKPHFQNGGVVMGYRIVHMTEKPGHLHFFLEQNFISKPLLLAGVIGFPDCGHVTSQQISVSKPAVLEIVHLVPRKHMSLKPPLLLPKTHKNRFKTKSMSIWISPWSLFDSKMAD